MIPGMIVMIFDDSLRYSLTMASNNWVLSKPSFPISYTLRGSLATIRRLRRDNLASSSCKYHIDRRRRRWATPRDHYLGRCLRAANYARRCAIKASFKCKLSMCVQLFCASSCLRERILPLANNERSFFIFHPFLFQIASRGSSSSRTGQFTF